MIKNSAIKRKDYSAPVKYLLKHGLIEPNLNALDYGAGYGYDADGLKYDKYDPRSFPDRPRKKYDLVTCVYVLNVILDQDTREKVVRDITSMLKPNGIAYIAVRRDVKKMPAKSQAYVELNLPSIVKNNLFEIYKLERK